MPQGVAENMLVLINWQVWCCLIGSYVFFTIELGADLLASSSALSQLSQILRQIQSLSLSPGVSVPSAIKICCYAGRSTLPLDSEAQWHWNVVASFVAGHVWGTQGNRPQNSVTWNFLPDLSIRLSRWMLRSSVSWISFIFTPRT